MHIARVGTGRSGKKNEGIRTRQRKGGLIYTVNRGKGALAHAMGDLDLALKLAAPLNLKRRDGKVVLAHGIEWLRYHVKSLSGSF